MVSKFNDTELFDGNISQVGVWNSTLTADEVSSLYNHGLPIDLTTDQAAYESSSNLVGYWRMGSGTLDTYPLIADQTNATLGSDVIDFPNASIGLELGWSFTNGILTQDGTGSGTASAADAVIDDADLDLDVIYQITVNVSAYTSGNAQLLLSTGNVDLGITGVGSYTVYGKLWSNNTLHIRAGYLDFVGSIDNVTVKQVNGNPAIMTNQTSSDIENGSPYANVILNTDFINGDNWSVTRGNWAISGGTLNTTSESDYCNTTIGDYSNKTMRVKFDIVSNTQGSVAFRIFGSSYQVGTSRSGVGTYTEDIVFQAGHNGDVGFIGNNFTGSIDNVTVEEVNTGLQGYWKMGDGTNDEYPVIYDQTNPDLGSELVTNGTFTTDSDWTKGTGWTISGGKLVGTNVSTQFTQQSLTFTSGMLYKVSFDITGVDTLLNDSAFRYPYDGAVGNIKYLPKDSPNGTYTNTFTSSGSSILYLGYIDAGTFTGTVDNVSVKEVQGNPATMTNMVEGNITNQYPLTKIRNYYRMGDGILDGYPIIQDQTSPNLAHIPTTNLILNSNVFVANSSTLTPNYGISPDGTQNSTRVETSGNNSGVRISISNSSNNDFAYSVFVKGVSGETVNVRVETSPYSLLIQYNFTFNGEWQRVENVLTASNTHTQKNFYVTHLGGSTATDFQVYGSQIEEQSQATAYIKSDGIAAVRKASTTNLITYSQKILVRVYIV